MRTTLVNPTANPTARRTRGGVMVIRANGAMANPRKRRRRRNAAPLIMPNPRRAASRRPVVVVANPRRRSARRSTIVVANPRRRRARRNPNDMGSIIKNVAIGGGAALGSYVLNRYVIADLFHNASEAATSDANRRGMLMRVGVRAVLAGLSAAFLPGSIGAAGMGAMLYPAIFEAHNWWTSRPGQTTAPLQADLEADLNAALYGSY